MARRRTIPPSVETSPGYAEHARHGGNLETGLVRAHEPEEPDDTAPLIRFAAQARANQAAAFDKISRCDAQLLVVPAQPGQLIPFSRTQARQHVLPSALFPVGLQEPIANGPRRRLEFSSEVVGVTTGTDQIDHLTAELRGIRNSGSWHDDTFRESVRVSTNPGQSQTTCVRANRFCDGYLADAFEAGLIVRVVIRAEGLLQAM